MFAGVRHGRCPPWPQAPLALQPTAQQALPPPLPCSTDLLHGGVHEGRDEFVAMIKKARRGGWSRWHVAVQASLHAPATPAGARMRASGSRHDADRWPPRALSPRCTKAGTRSTAPSTSPSPPPATRPLCTGAPGARDRLPANDCSAQGSQRSAGELQPPSPPRSQLSQCRGCGPCCRQLHRLLFTVSCKIPGTSGAALGRRQAGGSPGGPCPPMCRPPGGGGGRRGHQNLWPDAADL